MSNSSVLARRADTDVMPDEATSSIRDERGFSLVELLVVIL